MKKLLPVFLLIALALTAFAAGDDDPATLYETGRKAEATRDYVTALENYERILDIDEDYEDAFHRWEACMELAHWQEGLDGEPGAMDLVRLGELYRKFDRIEEERAIYQEALKLDPACAEAHGHLALSHYASKGGSLVTVIEQTLLFLEKSPYRDHLARAIHDFGIYGELRIMRARLGRVLDQANLKRKAGDPAGAAALLEAAAGEEEMPDAYRTALLAAAGKMRFGGGDLDGARKTFEACLTHAACSYTIEARLGLAAIAVAKGDPAGAMEDLRAAVAEGSGACKLIAAQQNKAFRSLFKSPDQAVAAEVEKLTDPEFGDDPIREEIEKAVVRAAEEDKHVLLYWYGPYCPYVMALEERLAHPEVRKALEDWVVVRIDYGSHHRAMTLDEEYGDVFETWGVPCLMALDGDGEVFDTKPDVDLWGTEDRSYDAEKIVSWLTLNANALK